MYWALQSSARALKIRVLELYFQNAEEVMIDHLPTMETFHSAGRLRTRLGKMFDEVSSLDHSLVSLGVTIKTFHDFSSLRHFWSRNVVTGPPLLANANATLERKPMSRYQRNTRGGSGRGYISLTQSLTQWMDKRRYGLIKIKTWRFRILNWCDSTEIGTVLMMTGIQMIT